MKKKMICCILLAVIIVLFSGCDVELFAPVDALMRPPKSYSQNEDLQKAFEDSVEGEFVLKYPLSGDYRSPFILYDTDNDGEVEAIVFYSLKKEENTVRVAFFDLTDGVWNKVAQAKGVGNRVNRVAFSDLYNDGTAKIMISWGFFDAKASNVLTIYEVAADENGEKKMRLLLNEPYSVMQVLDVDESGKDEILLISSVSAGEETNNIAKIFALRPDGSYAVAGSIVLDSTVSSYASIKAEASMGNKPYRVFIDAYNGDAGMVTEVLNWNAEINGFNSPFYNPQSKSVEKTFRASKIESRDIDGDGFIEIPVQPRDLSSANAMFDKATIRKKQHLFFLVEWCGMSNGNELFKEKYTAVNTLDAYMVDFPDEWLGKVIVSSNIEKRVFTFSEWNSDTQKAGKTVFDIITVTAGEWEASPIQGYTEIASNESLVYAVKLYDGASAKKLTVDKIRDMFTFL